MLINAIARWNSDEPVSVWSQRISNIVKDKWDFWMITADGNEITLDILINSISSTAILRSVGEVMYAANITNPVLSLNVGEKRP